MSRKGRYAIYIGRSTNTVKDLLRLAFHFFFANLDKSFDAIQRGEIQKRYMTANTDESEPPTC